MALFLVALDGMFEALVDALEYVLGRLGGLQFFQHVQEQHGIEARFLAPVGDVAHEFLDFLVQVVDGVAGRAFFDECAAHAEVHLAPFARLGQHAARRHQLVGHAQAFVAHLAGKAQEDAAFHFHELDAAVGEVQVVFQQRVVVAGQVGFSEISGIVHVR